MSTSTSALTTTEVHLLPGKAKNILRGHPWVFSGAIARLVVEDSEPQPGEWVRVMDDRGVFLGWGHWGSGSIAVRIISKVPDAIPDVDWWTQRLKACLAVREAAGLWSPNSPNRSGFRWVHGEGDGLSGLVVDCYSDIVVLQTHSMGMHNVRHDIVEGIRSAFGPALRGIADKSAFLLQKLEKNQEKQMTDGWLYGEPESGITEFEEHEITYTVDPIAGQKTGFFLDQRDNRRLLMEMVGDRDVLNAFSYTGGFSLAALRGGSGHVISLDASQAAVDRAHHHAEMNGVAKRHTSVCSDVMSYISKVDHLPPVVILDPPAYAKSRANRHKAVKGYQRLNEAALRKMPAGGLLWTFSCSQVVDAKLFEDTLVSAAIRSGKTVRILRRLGQPADHPTWSGHAEARYLKGLILYVE
ncbi:MAG: RlmI/RlmK family 23S rRNA methyltransferase [Crocinitomicaceae bacterium]|nr:RlmI/RlmK family 23S rRNA methyltransferase [Crocinitomicaceae bacterium]